MPRYFLALALPDEAKHRLVAVQPPIIPGMRLLQCHELHLTMHFLGELAVQHIDVVQKTLTQVRVDAFAITIRGVGRFPPEGQPQVLWAGVESNSRLIALHHSLGTALTEALGFQPEARPYTPHVTLARLNTPASPGTVERYLEANKDFQIASVLLKQFTLYSSSFADNLPQYQEEAVFQLLEPAA